MGRKELWRGSRDDSGVQYMGDGVALLLQDDLWVCDEDDEEDDDAAAVPPTAVIAHDPSPQEVTVWM